MKISKNKQGTSEWLQERLGKITGSRLKEVFKKNNLPFIYKLIGEDGIDGEDLEDGYKSEAMERGNLLEPIARKKYINLKNINIIEFGLCVHDKLDYMAISPDGFTEDRRGAIEVKCPSTTKHVEYCLINRIPNEYKYQVYQYFLVNEKLEWLDFVSYDDRYLPKPIHTFKITRDEIKDELIICKNKIKEFWQKKIKYQSKILNTNF